MELEYKIIKQIFADIASFENEVNEYIRQGWQPIGGMAFFRSRDFAYICQAMTRERRLTREEMQKRYEEARARNE